MRTAFTSHDVRRLHACSLCGDIGIYQPTHPEIGVPIVVCVHSTIEKPLTVAKKQRSFCHPMCYVKSLGIRKLLGLHADELNAIRLTDVSAKAMQLILHELREREGTGPTP